MLCRCQSLFQKKYYTNNYKSYSFYLLLLNTVIIDDVANLTSKNYDRTQLKFTFLVTKGNQRIL